MIEKLKTLDQFKKSVERFRRKSKRIVFTNGCFDILHAGHVRYLKQARNMGDVLVVGLNSDTSVRLIKGEGRPINSENHRAEVLAGLECVDFIIMFSDDNPYRLIQTLVPDILVKGADWPEDEIIGADIVKDAGGQVKSVLLVPEVSTSRILKRILTRYCP
jgi:D-beta-D-heptose 7-phosphate kinase/D-beta-D-heptose 1-phosphate adenosyltransferase